MIGFFRRSLNNWLAIGILGLVLVAFIVTGAVTREMTGGSAIAGDAVADVGGQPLYISEVAKRAQNAVEAARQQNPQLDMPGFVAQGGVEQVIDQAIGDSALKKWGEKIGIGASDRLIDGEIASIPAFANPAGKFDEQVMRALLAQRHISERDLREDIASGAIRRQILLPAAGGARVPTGIVLPYASLMLEARDGLVGIVPVATMPEGPAPADAEIAAWYQGHLARYTIPERRVLRYAIFGHDQAKAPSAPTDAEIAAFYKANPQAYAARETRTLAQVILPDQAAAQAFAAKVKGGTGFDAAAQAAGFAAADTKVGEVSRQQYAGKASESVAAAAFAVPSGAIAGPVKGDLGWYVVKVESVKGTPARSLADARAEIVNALLKQKADEALSQSVSAIDDAISNGSSFDDVARSEKLNVVITPALLPNGQAPDDPAFKPGPEMPLLMRSAGQMNGEDQPTVVTIGAGQSYALLSVSKVVPAAPAPLAKIRDQVVRDLVTQRRADAARRIAEGVVAKAKAGTPFAQAVAEAKLPPPQKAHARQLELSQAQNVPPPLTMMFGMKPGDTKLLSAPNNAGWFIVHLDTITPGDANTMPPVIEQTRAAFTRAIGEEYAQQLGAAARKAIGVRRNEANVAKLKGQLVGAPGQ